MARRLGFFVALMLVCCAATAGMLDQAAPSSIRSQVVRTFCVAGNAYVVVNLYVKPADVGRPGIVYAGMHDPDETQGYFFTSAGQTVQYMGEAMYVPYSVEANGLHDVALTLPVGPVGWKAFVGYGALSAQDEATVQSAQVALQRVRDSGKTAPTLDPNQHRRSFIQNDLGKNGKYSFVMAWTAEQVAACQWSGSN